MLYRFHFYLKTPAKKTLKKTNQKDTLKDTSKDHLKRHKVANAADCFVSIT